MEWTSEAEGLRNGGDLVFVLAFFDYFFVQCKKVITGYRAVLALSKAIWPQQRAFVPFCGEKKENWR